MKTFSRELNEALSVASNRQIREADAFASGIIMHHVGNIDKMMTVAVMGVAFYLGVKTYDKYIKPKMEKTDGE